MKKGYSVFGKAYEIMNKNDLHDIDSIVDVLPFLKDENGNWQKNSEFMDIQDK